MSTTKLFFHYLNILRLFYKCVNINIIAIYQFRFRTLVLYFPMTSFHYVNLETRTLAHHCMTKQTHTHTHTHTRTHARTHARTHTHTHTHTHTYFLTVRHDVAGMFSHHAVTVAAVDDEGGCNDRVGLLGQKLLKSRHIAARATNMHPYHALPVRLREVVDDSDTCNERVISQLNHTLTLGPG